MKNRTKSILSCLSVALVASIAGGVSVIKTTAEGNESTPVFEAAQTAGIRLADGADDVAGIRWEITMNQDYYTALNVAEGATVQFGAFVAPTKNLEEGESLDATTATNNQAVNVTIEKNTFTLGNVAENADVFTYYATINYNNVSGWTEEKQKAAYALELTVAPYVCVNGSYSYGTIGASRSIEALALHYLQNGTYTKDEVGAYLKSEVVESDENAGFYSLMDNEGTMANAHNLTTGDYRAYIGAQPVELTVSDKGLTVSGAKNLVAGEDSEYMLNVFADDGNVYTQPFSVATKVIDEVSDLSIFYLGDAAQTSNNKYINANIYDGYYVLTTDIEIKDTDNYTHHVLPAKSTTDNKTVNGKMAAEGQTPAGLTGVFDGRGHTISNLKMSKGGLFGAVVGGTVKNVAFTNVSFDPNDRGERDSSANWGSINDICTIATIIDGGLLENVYIYVPTMKPDAVPELLQSGTYKSYDRSGAVARSALVSSFITDETVMKNCIFRCDTYTYTSSGETYNGVGKANAEYGSLMGDCRGTDYQWENVYVICSVPLANCTINGTYRDDFSADASNQNPDPEQYQTPFTGVSRYNTEEDIIAANIDFSSFAASGYWQVMPKALPYISDSAVEVVVKQGNYELNHETGKFSDTDTATLFGSANVVIAEATLDGVALTVTDGKVNVPTAQHGEALTILYRLEGETKFYAVTTTVVTKYIKEASDLSIFYLGDAAQTSNNKYINANIYDGYYVLTTDIEIKDTDNYTHHVLPAKSTTDSKIVNGKMAVAGQTPAGLTGVFDGRGHTISNLKMSKGGLFGAVVGGTVKNVAFTNVSFDPNKRGETDTTTWGSINDICTIATVIDGGLMENVYIHVPTMRMDSRSDNVQRSALVSSFITDETVMKNCIFRCDTYTYTSSGETYNGVGKANAEYGSLMGDCRGTDYQWENVYVICSVPLANCTINGTYRDDFSADASNQNPNSELYQTPFTGVSRYNTQGDFEQAIGNVYTSFNSTYWDTTSGVPVWRVSGN